MKNKMKYRTIILAAALMAVCGLSHAETDGPLARRMETAPVIDGKLTEWNSFPQIAMSQPNVPDLKVTRASMPEKHLLRNSLLLELLS